MNPKKQTESTSEKPIYMPTDPNTDPASLGFENTTSIPVTITEDLSYKALLESGVAELHNPFNADGSRKLDYSHADEAAKTQRVEYTPPAWNIGEPNSAPVHIDLDQLAKAEPSPSKTRVEQVQEAPRSSEKIQRQKEFLRRLGWAAFVNLRIVRAGAANYLRT